MGLFKPAWMSKNAAKAEAAAKAETDPKALAEIAEKSQHFGARWAAVRKLEEQETLKKVAATDPVLKLRLAAIEKIQDERFLAALANEMRHKEISSAVFTKLISANILFELATTGKFQEIVEEAAIKLTKMGDNRAIIHFDEICRRGGFAKHGSLGVSMFLHQIIKIADNAPCEETVAFLESHYMSRGRQNSDNTAYIAQHSLRSILKKVAGTPLAERIQEIKDIDKTVSYNMY